MDWKIPAETIEKAKLGIVNTISRYIDLQKKGSEYVACCPFHSEKTPSFSVVPDKNMFYCFGCGSGGDATDFVMQFEGINFREAVHRIAGNMPSSGVAPSKAPAIKAAADEWQPVVPVPAEVTQQPMDTFNRRKGDGWERLVSSNRWAYRDADGGLIGYACRFELPGGGKDVIPQSYCVNTETGECRWRWQSFPKPRPLYGLDKLAAYPNAQVLIAEGEKACDAAQERYEAEGISKDKLITVSWPGGGKAIKYIDWSPLADRAVGLWPDADQKPYPENHPLAGQLMPFGEQPGAQAMADIGQRLDGVAKAIKVIMPPEGVPDGWDLADPFPAGFNLLAHTRNAALLIDDFRAKFAGAATVVEDVAPWEEQPEAASEPDAEVEEEPAEQTKGNQDEDHDDLVKNGYFTILGYDGDEYFFFQHEKRQILSRTKGDFSDTGLIELAPINWWEEYFPGEKGINKKSAINWIFRTANSRGIYDPTRVRGRGAWIDKGRNVYHHGSYLTMDGGKLDITRIDSAFVYPMARSMLKPAEMPLSDEEGKRLVEVAAMPRWSTPGSAALMAGWVMLAPICGALSWRPHIWLTGSAGSGKTTLQKKFCGGLTRGISVYANGNSTEAGIRQELKSDALPVMIDEFESNNEREKQRVENVMSLIRQTSSETQAKTLKGTVTGDGMNFDIRSMFCLASINTNLPTKADVDRLTILSLKPNGTDNWVKLEAELNKIDEDATISARLLARALAMMPVILDTVKVFRRVAAKKFERQRDGDQYGTLLAGCWCLMSREVPTDDEAMALINGYDWSEHREDSDLDEAMRALEAILAAKLRVAQAGEFSVYELIREASSMHRQGVIDNLIADATLRRHGIRAEFATGELWFGTGVSTLKHLVDGMPFVTDLRGQLLRVPGAKRLSGVKKFNGIDSKCIALPIAPILQDSNDPNDLPI